MNQPPAAAPLRHESEPPAGDPHDDPALPLYVDMDGTLLLTDTLHESMLLALRRDPQNLWRWPGWLAEGKAGFKRRIADVAVPDPAGLPYNQPLLAWLRTQRAQGRRLILASAADLRVVRAVADHLSLFDDVLGSNAAREPLNLSREHKRMLIEQHAREAGFAHFAYAGNSADDLPVWAGARAAIAHNAPARVVRALRRQHPQARVVPGEPLRLATVLRAIRLTQWAKNALLFVPLLAAHITQPGAWLRMVLAFVAFGLCASATYLVNDMLDLANDRRHAYKRHRPLAAGRLSIGLGLGLMAALMAAALGLAAALSRGFALLLLAYVAVTLAYSFRLKRVALVDVLLLSGLYTLRIGAGAVVAGVLLSNWLLAISLFLFLSLALVKRCAELEEMDGVDALKVPGRGYRRGDLPLLRAFGVASGFLAVMVFTLYIDSQNVRQQYAEPQWLWVAGPLLLAWIMRMWLKAGRRELHGEDPLQFALKDRLSWLIGAAMGAVALLATTGCRLELCRALWGSLS